MSLFAWIMTGIYLPVYVIKIIILFIIYTLGYIVSIASGFTGAIIFSVIGALSFITVIFAFLPVSWVVSIIAGVTIVYSETIFYWVKRIWEIVRG